MRVIAICGSYRRGKTIDTLIDAAMEGVRQADPSAETEKICLVDKDIRYCTNCMACRRDDPALAMARCVIRDEMQEIYPKMLQADGYIFATPVNCGTVTALMKTFIERSIWVFSKPGTMPLKGCPAPRSDRKKAAILIVSSGIVPPGLRWFCDDATKLLKDLASTGLNARVVANMYAGAVEERGVSRYLHQAREAGKRLARAKKH